MTAAAQQTSIGGYKIIDTLGKGGMGVVYMAQHELLGRKAAIKVLLPEFSNHQEVVERFFKEAKASTAIKHPGIVNVYDFGYQDDGSAYIAMEYMEGEALDARLQRLGKLPIEQALRFAGQMTSALAAAHHHGIVHRDLKPPNVFIVPDSHVTGGERIKLLDFGIAKFTVTDDPDAQQTRADAILGSPQYMAPEQIRGSRDVDRRADLYSVGCMLFEMLCGQPPFHGRGQGAMAIMAAQLDDPPPIPSSLNPELSRELDALILYLLAKDPAQRYQSAQDVAAALAAISGEQVSFDTLPEVTAQMSQTDLSTGSGVALSPAGVPLSDSQIVSQITSQATQNLRVGAGGHTVQTRTEAARAPASKGRMIALAAAGIAVAAVAIALLMTGGSETPTDQVVAENMQPEPEETDEPAPEEDDNAGPQHTYRKILLPPREGGDGMPEVMIVLVPPEGETVDWSKTVFSFDRLVSGELFKDLITTIQRKAAPPPTVTWRIASRPPKAEIVEHGEVIGTTPLTIQLDKDAAIENTYTLRAPGHDDATVTLSGAEDFDETVTLAPKIAVAIQSRPKGAEIIDADGKSLGTTPGKVLLSRSTEPAALTLRLEGYEDLAVEVVPDRKKKERFELVKKRAMITHRIETEPSGAGVFKGKTEVGVTPYEVQFLEEEGRIKYRVELEGYRKKTVRLHADRDDTATVALKKCEEKKRSRRRSAPVLGNRPTVVRIYNDPC